MKHPLPALFALISYPLFQTTLTAPLFPESVPFSVTQSASFDETIDYRFSEATPILGFRFSSRAPMPQADQPRFPEFVVRSWTMEFTPNDELSFFAGSISWSGLASRMANPARSEMSPFAAVSGVRAGATIRPSWAVGREYLGTEWNAKYLRLAAFASPTSPLDNPAWVQCTVGIPLKQDSRPALSLSIFSGLAHREATAEDSWFYAEPILPERSILLPGAELAFDLGRFSGNLVGMANLGAFTPPKFAFTGDVGFAGRVFRAGASCFLGDPSFVSLDGTLLTVRQSACASGSVRVPLPGGPSDEFAAGASFGVKRTTNRSMTEAGTTAFSGGGEIKAAIMGLRASVKSDTDEEETKISAKLGFPDLIPQALALDLMGCVSFTQSKFSPDGWSDGSASARIKTGRFGPLAADFRGTISQAKPDSPIGVEFTALVNLVMGDALANWTVIGSVTGKPRENEYAGSLSVRADFP